jgi:hypothetical protein
MGYVSSSVFIGELIPKWPNTLNGDLICSCTKSKEMRGKEKKMHGLIFCEQCAAERISTNTPKSEENM